MLGGAAPDGVYVEVWRQDPVTGNVPFAEGALWRGYLTVLPRQGETIMLTLTGPDPEGTEWLVADVLWHLVAAGRAVRDLGVVSSVHVIVHTSGT